MGSSRTCPERSRHHLSFYLDASPRVASEYAALLRHPQYDTCQPRPAAGPQCTRCSWEAFALLLHRRCASTSATEYAETIARCDMHIVSAPARYNRNSNQTSLLPRQYIDKGCEESTCFGITPPDPTTTPDAPKLRGRYEKHRFSRASRGWSNIRRVL